MNAKIRVRPLTAADDGNLPIHETKLRRDGFSLKETTLEGFQFKVGRGFRTGIEVDVAVGVVQTARGPVLLTSEVPTSRVNPLEQIVEELTRH